MTAITQNPVMAGVRRGTLFVVLALWLAVILGPYVIMFLTSMTPSEELARAGASLWPGSFSTASYRELIATTPFLTYLRNSLLVAAVAVPLALVCAVGAAIALSRHEFKGRQAFMTAVLVAQLLPAVLLVVSLQGQLRVFNLLDNIVGLALVHAAFATPFATWLLKGFLDSVPKDLEEAARIDGASSPQVTRLIILPLLAPGMVAAGTYIFILTWNEFLYALTFMQSTGTRTLPVGLNLFIGEYQIRWDLLTAGGVLAVVPVIIGFLLVQKRLVSGLAAGAVKG